MEGIFSAITCEKATYPDAVKSELEAIPEGYSVIKEMIYPYESIEKITLKDDKYLITVFDDNFVICKEDCNYDLVNFLNDLIERTGK